MFNFQQYCTVTLKCIHCHNVIVIFILQIYYILFSHWQSSLIILGLYTKLHWIILLTYLHKSQHVPVQDMFCKMVSHLRCWIQLEMIYCKLVVKWRGKLSLIIMVCIPELIPGDFPLVECQTPDTWSIQDVVLYFFLNYVVE